MENLNEYSKLISKVEFFKKMYHAHDIIADIRERINKLYESATYISPINDGMPKSEIPTPYKFSNVITEIADLRILAEKILKQRARFDLFICNIDPFWVKVLIMRCNNEMSWKIIARNLRISISTAKQIMRKIIKAGEDFDVF